MFFVGTHHNRAAHAGTGLGGCRSSAVSRRKSVSRVLGIATSAIWKATLRPWLKILAPILISFSFRLVSDQFLIASGSTRIRRKLPYPVRETLIWPVQTTWWSPCPAASPLWRRSRSLNLPQRGQGGARRKGRMLRSPAHGTRMRFVGSGAGSSARTNV